jgi:DNA-binding transcriptional LysR family regulator
MASNAGVDRVPFPARLQNALVFHQAEVLGRVLDRGIDGFGDVSHRHLLVAQGPQDQKAIHIAKEPANLRPLSGYLLNLSQPAVSAQIKTLEAYLGVQLFERNGRSITLTETGQLLFHRAEALLLMTREVEEVVRYSDNRIAGDLVIGCSAPSGVYVLPYLIARFKRLYPDVRVTVPIVSDEVAIDRLRTGEYGVGIVNKDITEPGFMQFEMFTAQVVLIVPSTHPWASQVSILPEDLLQERFICQVSDSTCRRVVSQTLQAAGLDIRKLDIVMEIDSPEAQAIAVENGLGLSFIPRLAVVPRLALGKLAMIKVERLEISYPIYVTYHQDHVGSPVYQTFLKFLQHPQNQQLINMMAQGHLF